MDLRDASHEEAVEAIRKAGNPVSFLVQSIIHRPRVSLQRWPPPVDPVHPSESRNVDAPAMTTAPPAPLCNGAPVSHVSRSDLHASAPFHPTVTRVYLELGGVLRSQETRRRFSMHAAAHVAAHPSFCLCLSFLLHQRSLSANLGCVISPDSPRINCTFGADVPRGGGYFLRRRCSDRVMVLIKRDPKRLNQSPC